jgi:hypothetical protein
MVGLIWRYQLELFPVDGPADSTDSQAKHHPHSPLLFSNHQATSRHSLAPHSLVRIENKHGNFHTAASLGAFHGVGAFCDSIQCHHSLRPFYAAFSHHKMRPGFIPAKNICIWDTPFMSGTIAPAYITKAWPSYDCILPELIHTIPDRVALVVRLAKTKLVRKSRTER